MLRGIGRRSSSKAQTELDLGSTCKKLLAMGTKEISTAETATAPLEVRLEHFIDKGMR